MLSRTHTLPPTSPGPEGGGSCPHLSFGDKEEKAEEPAGPGVLPKVGTECPAASYAALPPCAPPTPQEFLESRVPWLWVCPQPPCTGPGTEERLRGGLLTE